MKLTSPVIVLLLAVIEFKASMAQNAKYPLIAGYAPQSQVTDILNIDLDQESLESQLVIGSDESFKLARKYYTEGAHSESVATLKLSTPYSGTISKGSALTGQNVNGDDINGFAYREVTSGSFQILFRYRTAPTDEMVCHVGARPVGQQNLTGCLVRDGTISLNQGGNILYQYDPFVDNNNGRTLQTFSTMAEGTMYLCEKCPYSDFLKYREYYGRSDYADEWIIAAFEERQTDFLNGNVNYYGVSTLGRSEAIKKGASYMALWMYVISKLESALRKCQDKCLLCNGDALQDWDEAVALYTGSLEGEDGSGHGFFPYALADKRCANFRTCGKNRNSSEGHSAVNHEIFHLFQIGQLDINNGVCAPAGDHKKRIVNLMTVPLIQGTLKYAYILERQNAGDKEKAEGAVFAAAVLPMMSACNKEDTATVWENMALGSGETNYEKVLLAFSNNYKCLGIKCDDIGGLYDAKTGAYYERAQPCNGEEFKMTPWSIFLLVFLSFGACFLCFLLTCCCLPLRRRKLIKRGMDMPRTQDGICVVEEEPDDGKTEFFTLSQSFRFV